MQYPKYATIHLHTNPVKKSFSGCGFYLRLELSSYATESQGEIKETEFPVYFGEWIKQRRKTLDLTQAELAGRAACSLPGLRKIEAGVRRPSKQLAELLAKGLEVPVEERSTFVRVARVGS